MRAQPGTDRALVEGEAISAMKKRLLGMALSLGLIWSAAAPAAAVVHHTNRRVSAAQARRIRHRRHVRTAKRVGIGAAGGAAVGALAGGGKGAGIGAAAGAGAGALYDRHKRK